MIARAVLSRCVAVWGLALAAVLSGCGGVDDVELNGKIFDAMGVSSKSKTTTKEPKMVARAPLVVPPTVDRLPAPGAQPGADGVDIASINDPDRLALQSQADLERQQAEYCKIHYEFPKARGDASADSAEGPLGPCRGSFLNSLKKFSGKADEGEGQEGQVER
jgi:hypothetical protein